MIISARFESTCGNCKNRIQVDEAINWQRGVSIVTHANIGGCVAATERAMNNPQPIASNPAAVTANAAPIADFIRAARERGLKFPKVTFLGPQNAELTLTLAGAKSTNPGAVFVKLAGDYMGSIATDGVVRGKLAYRPELLSLLQTIAADPATAAAAYGKLSGRCSFCRTRLTDDRTGSSVEVGYGPVCARRYGLPHAPKGKAKTLAPLPASLVSGADVDETAYGADPLFQGPAFEDATL